MKILLLLLFLFVSGCNDEGSIRTYSIPKNNKAIIESIDTNKNDVSSNSKSKGKNNIFNWIAPDHWREGKISSMRLAS